MDSTRRASQQRLGFQAGHVLAGALVDAGHAQPNRQTRRLQRVRK